MGRPGKEFQLSVLIHPDASPESTSPAVADRQKIQRATDQGFAVHPGSVASRGDGAKLVGSSGRPSGCPSAL